MIMACVRVRVRVSLCDVSTHLECMKNHGRKLLAARWTHRTPQEFYLCMMPPARANTCLSFSSISFHLSHRASRVLAHTRAATAADNRSVPRRVIAAQGDRSVERLKEGCELKLLPGAQSLLKSTRLARCSPGTQMIQQHSHTATMMPPPVWLSLFRPQL